VRSQCRGRKPNRRRRSRAGLRNRARGAGSSRATPRLSLTCGEKHSGSRTLSSQPALPRKQSRRLKQKRRSPRKSVMLRTSWDSAASRAAGGCSANCEAGASRQAGEGGTALSLDFCNANGVAVVSGGAGVALALRPTRHRALAETEQTADGRGAIGRARKRSCRRATRHQCRVSPERHGRLVGGRRVPMRRRCRSRSECDHLDDRTPGADAGVPIRQSGRRRSRDVGLL
jgi:hypothetical protein